MSKALANNLGIVLVDSCISRPSSVRQKLVAVLNKPITGAMQDGPSVDVLFRVDKPSLYAGSVTPCLVGQGLKHGGLATGFSAVL